MYSVFVLFVVLFCSYLNNMDFKPTLLIVWYSLYFLVVHHIANENQTVHWHQVFYDIFGFKSELETLKIAFFLKHISLLINIIFIFTVFFSLFHYSLFSSLFLLPLSFFSSSSLFPLSLIFLYLLYSFFLIFCVARGQDEARGKGLHPLI